MDEGKNTVRESSGSKLNLYTKPFRTPANVPAFERTLIDHDRTLFLKFFTGFPPISMEEIQYYFTRRFGNCIESLDLPGRNERDSELGIITFSTSQFRYELMGQSEEVMLFICSKPVHFMRSRSLDGNNNQNK
ncbi:uncharacterized protein LOC111391705 [Olea europaea var. sylvestris]|uniref:Uncharacterized protein n=1 Tax=Olea europaea subsp. europaea TaxID=158383 RepID=A0A8S0URP9_OLEEU|nr:uncharacterized protein LOC111391705 [Olea europaea var. sylvestris]CAA3020889.1 Hypothetical predicted protein [Olea europaea subsp. europaea]